jgi:hypothetical protein
MNQDNRKKNEIITDTHRHGQTMELNGLVNNAGPVSGSSNNCLPLLDENMDFNLENKASTSANVLDGDLEECSMETTSFIHEPRFIQQSTPRLRSLSVDSNVESMILLRYEKHHHTLYVTFLLFILLLVYAMSERYSITAGYNPNLTTDHIKALNDRNTTQAYFGAQSLNVNDNIRTRVVYFILDGLRFDATQTNPSLNALLTSPWFARDSLILKMSAQVPTMSVPNWQTLITGARPSLHGRTGNDILTPYTFDSIFSSSMSVGMQNGLSGDGWWSTLLNGHLTPFYGDGTSPTLTNKFGDAFYTHGHSDHNKDIAYNQRFHDAINSQTVKQRSNESNAIVRFDYDLFLSYYGDIDGESHSFGAQSSQTQSAIDDKVAFVRAGINAITALDAMTNTRTVFIVTSDHGHVNAGGHGGDAHVLKTVPCIVYAKDSQLASVKNSLPLYSIFDTVDIATSITALLGVPVPRQSEGSFISPLISALVSPSKWIRLYFDLYKQKRALASALLTQWSQSSLKSQYASLFTDDAEVTAGVAELNTNIETLSALIKISKAHRIASITTKNIIFSLLIAIFSIATICIVFHRTTFLDLITVLPTSIVCVCTRGWRRSLWSRRQTANIDECKSVPFNIQRLHQMFLLLAVVIIGIWWSLMMILLLVAFAYGYRPTAEWRWQFTLFNSTHDAYVLIIGICIFGSFVVTALIASMMWFILSVKAITTWLSQFLRSSFYNQDVEPTIISPAVSLYYLSFYVVLVFNVNAILLHLSQSYHCLWLPSIRPVTIVTEMAWNARFQSLTVSFMMLPAMLSLMVIDVLVRHHLFRQVFVLHRRKDQEFMMTNTTRRIALLHIAAMRAR